MLAQLPPPSRPHTLLRCSLLPLRLSLIPTLALLLQWAMLQLPMLRWMLLVMRVARLAALQQPCPQPPRRQLPPLPNPVLFEPQLQVLVLPPFPPQLAPLQLNQLLRLTRLCSVSLHLPLLLLLLLPAVLLVPLLGLLGALPVLMLRVSAWLQDQRACQAAHTCSTARGPASKRPCLSLAQIRPLSQARAGCGAGQAI